MRKVKILVLSRVLHVQFLVDFDMIMISQLAAYYYLIETATFPFCFVVNMLFVTLSIKDIKTISGSVIKFVFPAYFMLTPRVWA